MTDEAPGPGWWLAVDGQWYPPEQHPDYRAPESGSTAVPESSPTQLAPDWWMAVDGQWYPPERHPDYRAPVVTPPARVAPPSAAPPGLGAGGPAGAGGVMFDEPPTAATSGDETPAEPGKASPKQVRLGFIAALAIALLALIGVGLFTLLSSDDDSSTPDSKVDDTAVLAQCDTDATEAKTAIQAWKQTYGDLPKDFEELAGPDGFLNSSDGWEDRFTIQGDNVVGKGECVKISK